MSYASDGRILFTVGASYRNEATVNRILPSEA